MMNDKYVNFNKMYRALHEAGYPDIKDFKSGTDYVNAIKPIPEDFIDIVLKWLPKLERKVGVIMFLRESRKKYDGSIIPALFEEANTLDKWFICDALVHNPPLHLEQWVMDTYLNKKYGYSETGLLPLAVVKMFPRDEAREILKQGFDHHYRVTPYAFGKVGRLEDIPFLEERLRKTYDASHVHKDIQKAIERIKKKKK